MTCYDSNGCENGQWAVSSSRKNAVQSEAEDIPLATNGVSPVPSEYYRYCTYVKVFFPI